MKRIRIEKPRSRRKRAWLEILPSIHVTRMWLEPRAWPSRPPAKRDHESAIGFGPHARLQEPGRIDPDCLSTTTMSRREMDRAVHAVLRETFGHTSAAPLDGVDPVEIGTTMNPPRGVTRRAELFQARGRTQGDQTRRR